MEALKSLGFEWHVFLLNIIVFIILFLILRRYLVSSAVAVMAKRAQEIAEGLEAAQQHKEALAKANEERERVLAEAREEGREKVREAVQEADQVRERLVAEAREEAQHVRERGPRGGRVGARTGAAGTAPPVVDLALLAASRAVVQRLDDRAHRQAVEEFVTSLEQHGVSDRRAASRYAEALLGAAQERGAGGTGADGAGRVGPSSWRRRPCCGR